MSWNDSIILIYIAYIVTRAKDIDMLKRKTTRTVFLVYVVGKRNAGKTSFLRSFVDRYVGTYSKDEIFPECTINSVQIKKQEAYIIVSITQWAKSPEKQYVECIFDNMAQRTPSDCFFGDFVHWEYEINVFLPYIISLFFGSCQNLL